MTDLVTIAMIAAVPPTVAAGCALAVGVMNHWQGSAIHVLVNSNMAEMKKDLTDAHNEIKTLREMITAMSTASKQS